MQTIEVTAFGDSDTLEVRIGHTSHLAEAPALHDAIENRETSGKVVLTI